MKIPLEKSEFDKYCYIGGGLFILFATFVNTVSTFKYGKLADTEKDKSKKKSGLVISARINWRFAFIPTVIVPWIVYFYTDSPFAANFPNMIAMGIYYIHYFNRCIIYPSKIQDNAEPSPLWFFIGCFIGASINTFVQYYYLLNLVDCSNGRCATYPLFWAGIWFTGFLMNFYHDNILTSLKAEGKGYQIPRGGLFEYISSANFLGEIIEWWAYAGVTKSAPQIIFAIWSTNFLMTRGRNAHAYYRQRFGNKYPKERKAVIPFLY